jgi:hypothetical protein
MSKCLHARGLCLLAVLVSGLVDPLSAQVTFEVVNDSGKPDSSVYIKVPGRLWADAKGGPMFPTNLFVNIADPSVSAAAATAIPLSTLATNYSAAPYEMVSTISGRTNKVYSFQCDFVASGSVYFCYDKPFVFTNALQPSAPPDSAGNALRYDYAELSINTNTPENNAVDVTYVDKFGIPLQMEWFSGSKLVSGSYVYLSTRTLVEQFAVAGLGQAVFSLTTSNIAPGWQYTGPGSFTNFARILAPQKVSGTTPSVAPYRGVAAYLNSLVGSSNSFQLNGASPQKNYH